MQSVKVLLGSKMRIIIFLITLLILSQTFVMAGDRKIDSIPEEMRTLRKEKYNDVWNDFVLRDAKFVDERNSWAHGDNVTGFKPEGIYRRLVVCYTEEEGNLLQKYDLLVDKRIPVVMERSLKRLWDSADGVDYALIMQKSSKFLRNVSKTMLDNQAHWEDVALPEILMEVFNELNEEDKARQINLKLQNDKRKKIDKQKKEEEERIFKTK